MKRANAKQRCSDVCTDGQIPIIIRNSGGSRILLRGWRDDGFIYDVIMNRLLSKRRNVLGIQEQ
jgi:hypothetical protein